MKTKMLLILMSIIVCGGFAQTNIYNTYNGDFELGNISNWRAVEVTNGVALSIENETTNSSVSITNDSNSGTNAAEFTWGVDPLINDIVFDLNTPVLSSTNYIFRASSKSISSACILRIHCTFYNSSGGIVGDYNDASWQLGNNYTEHEWAIPTSPAGSSYAVIGFRAFNTDGSRWPATSVTTLIDDVQLWENYVEVNLTTSTSGTGTGNITYNPPSANGNYPDGTQVTITAAPDSGSEFISWSGDASGTTNPIVITMNGNKSIDATINEVLIPKNIVSSLNGYFELGSMVNWRAVEVVNGSVLSIENEPTISTVVMTNDANNGNYAAKLTWGVDPSIQDIIFDQNPTVLPQTDYIYKASAKSLSGPCILRIHCTFYNGSGTILGDYNDMSWQLNSTYTEHQWNIPQSPIGTVSATVGFRVFNTDGSRWPATTITTVIDDVQLWENSVGEEYVLATNLLGTGTGSLTLTPSGGIYPVGTQVSISANPYYGSEFDSWSGDASGSTNPIVITMDGHKNVSATLNDQTFSFVEMANDAASGGNAVKFTWRVDTSIEDIVFDLKPNVLPQTNYIFKANAKSESGPCILRIHCAFYDVGGAILGDYNDTTWQLTNTYTEHQWNLPESPIGSSFAVIGFRVYNTDGSRWPITDIITLIDNVQLWENYIGTTYNLTTNIVGTGIGSISLDPPGGIYLTGTQVTITANPNIDSEFDSWSGDANGSINPLIITVDGDKNITATLNKIYNATNVFDGWNGDFELGNLLHWRSLEVAGGSVLSVENDPTFSTVSISNDSNNGIYSGQLIWGSDSTIQDIVFDLNVPVNPQTDYTFKATAKSQSGPCILRIHSTFYDINGAIVGDYNDATWQLTNTFQEHEWSLPNSPVGSSFAVIGFRLFNTNGARWPTTNITTVIDDAQLWELTPISSNRAINVKNETVEEIETEYESSNLNVYPNPFSLATTLAYALEIDTFIDLSVFDIQGSLVTVLVKEKQLKGKHTINWNGGYLPNGVYFIRLITTKGNTQVVKILINK